MTLNRLPNRRPCVTHALRVGGIKMYLHEDLYSYGLPGAVTIDTAKAGSMLRGFLDATTWDWSESLQRGEPLSSIVRRHKGHTFEPNGEVQYYDGIDSCTSLTDLLARVLEAEHQGAP